MGDSGEFSAGRGRVVILWSSGSSRGRGFRPFSLRRHPLVAFPKWLEASLLPDCSYCLLGPQSLCHSELQRPHQEVLVQPPPLGSQGQCPAEAASQQRLQGGPPAVGAHRCSRVNAVGQSEGAMTVNNRPDRKG